MKIVHVTPSYLPRLGGVETHLAAIVKLQREDGHEVEVIQEGEFRPAFYPPLESNNSSQKWRYKFYIWQQIWRRRHQLLAADIVHVHDVFWWVLPLYPLIWRKVMTTFHGWEGHYPVRWQAKAQRYFYNQLSRATVHVGAWIQEFYWDKPTAVIYGGIPERKAIKPLSLTSKKTLNFIFLGRLESANDVELFARAFHRWQLQPWLLGRKIKAVTITWVGDGSQRELCQTVGKVTGQVKNPEPYLQTADVVLAASYLSILQAQAAGKLVGAIYSNPLKRRYLQTLPTVEGMIVADNTIELEQRLSELLADSTKLGLLNRSLKQSLPKLSWENVNKIYYRLYAKAR